MVTLKSQNLSEFDLHIRAILGLPIPEITCPIPSATRVISSKTNLDVAAYSGLQEALKVKNSDVLIFGKKTAHPGRRMGVSVATGKSIEDARENADKSAACIDFFEAN